MYMKNPVNDVNTSYFSEAELRVVKLLASGSSEKEIADRLCISRHTVDNHLRNIRERFGLHKNTEISVHCTIEPQTILISQYKTIWS